MEAVRALSGWLRSDAGLRANVLMPLASGGGKRPRHRHADGSWTWARFDETLSRVSSGAERMPGWGLLLRTLVALDFDSDEEADRFEADPDVGPYLRRAPMERTSKGRHYLFARPAWADSDGYFDGARQRRGLDVDVKTLCATGTSGMLVVAPSEGKTWVRPPWSGPLEEIPRVLLDRVAVARSGGPVAPPAEAGSADPSETLALVLPASFARERDPVVRLLALLSKVRWDDRSCWRSIATALKYEHEKDHEKNYLDAFKRFSRLSPKYSEAEADRLWASVAREDYSGPRVTLGTLHRWAREDDPLGYAELRASTVPSVVQDNWDKEDRGLADVAHHLLHDRIKRCGTRGSLYYFDEAECRWREGTEASVRRMVSLAVEEALRDVHAMYALRERAETDDVRRREIVAMRDRVLQRIKYVRKHSGATAVTSFAAHMFQADGFEQELDKHAHLLGVANGVVDLRTGTLRARRPEDYIHRVIDTAYDPEADQSLIRATVLSAMADAPDMAEYLQHLLGYGITGETCEEVFAVFIGSGRNCKGVLTQALADVLQTFYVSMNAGLVCDRQVSNLDAERGKLLGARVAVFDELRPGERLKTHEVQLLSGGDGIPARPLYKDPMTIRPRHLNILSTNYMPELTEVIPAIVERLVCIPFPVTYADLLPGEEPSTFRRQKDETLKRRLSESKAGTLAWLVSGAVSWYASRGLRRGAPAAVQRTTREYVEEQDRLAAFLREQCEVGDPRDPDFRASSATLLGAYNDYLKEAGCTTRATDKTLVASLRTKGFERKVARLPGHANAVSCFLGLRLACIVDGDGL